MKLYMTRVAGEAGFRALRWLLCLVVLFAVCLPGAAQVVTGTIQGRVFDTTGAVIPQATVTAVNTNTGLSRPTTASATGDYQIPSLPVGDYTVTAEKSGFQKLAKKIRLEVGTVGSLDFNLPVARGQTGGVGAGRRRGGRTHPHHGELGH